MTERLGRVVIGVFAVIIVLAMWAAPPVLTQSASPCDPSLVQPPDNPLGYRLRGNRCEGVYVKEVAGLSGLVVASFTEGPYSLEIPSTKAVNVTWKSPGDSPIRLRAISLRRRLYYRMDTAQPSGSRSFQWPADLLASLQMTGPDLGIVGWTMHAIGRQMTEVYVPLQVGAAATSRPASRYKLVLLPGAELSEVFVTVLKLTASGEEGAVLQRDEPLAHGFYPAERPLSISLPALVDPAFYRLEIGAVLRRGGSTTRSMTLYRPPA